MSPRTAGAAAILLAAIVAAAAAGAQTLDVERPRTLVVGTPPLGARTDRIDGARSGRSSTALPGAASAGLRSEWRMALGEPLDVAPVVDGGGTTYVVGARGEAIAVARDGTEKWRVSTGAIQPGPPALLSDDTLVFADAGGDAIALREGALRWRVRFGRADPTRPVPPAPLPLEDGGIVVATTHELAALDADGHERSRVTLPEPASSPVLAALGKVVVVTSSGAVWTWAPGAADMTRVGGFGGPVDDGAALVDEHTLVAITAGRLHLAAVDLVRGTLTTRAVSPAGLFLGPPALRAGSAFLQLQASAGDLAVAFDASGAETFRGLLEAHPPPVSADGGPAQLVAGPHTAPLVDGAGTLAFALADGSVGVLAGGVVDLLAGACPQARPPAAPTAGIAPLGPGVFVAACRSGTLMAIRGAVAASGEPAPPHL